MGVYERLYDNARQKQAVLAAATLGVPLEDFPTSSDAYGDDAVDAAQDGDLDEAGEYTGNAGGNATNGAALAGAGSMYLI